MRGLMHAYFFRGLPWAALDGLQSRGRGGGRATEECKASRSASGAGGERVTAIGADKEAARMEGRQRRRCPPEITSHSGSKLHFTVPDRSRH